MVHGIVPQIQVGGGSRQGIVIPDPNTLSPERAEEATADAVAFGQYALEQVEAVVGTIGNPDLQRLVYRTAFTTEGAAPKPTRRPHLRCPWLVDLTYQALAEEPTERDAVVRLSLALTEQLDLLDDLADGDVEAGAEGQVLATTQALGARITEGVAALGETSVAYHRETSDELLGAVLLEAEREPSAAAYEQVLARQSTMYGRQTGLAAIAAGADEEEVTRAERAGRRFHDIAKVEQDRAQYRAGDRSDWNARTVLDRPTIIQRLEEWRAELLDAVSAFPPAQRRRVAALVAHDFTASVPHEREA